MMYETLEYVKNKYPHIDVIAGNVATPAGVKRMIDSGADAIKDELGLAQCIATKLLRVVFLN